MTIKTLIANVADLIRRVRNLENELQALKAKQNG
jgi:hypothetical protein